MQTKEEYLARLKAQLDDLFQLRRWPALPSKPRAAPVARGR